MLDRWCLARLAETVDAVRAAMDVYEVSPACRAVVGFVEDVSKWYLQRSRDRFWKGGGSGSVAGGSANATLHTSLLTLSGLLAPFTPFLAERMYRNLAGFGADGAPPGDTPDSVHLTEYPAAPPGWRDTDVLGAMARVRRLVELGLAARSEAKIKVQQPLAVAVVVTAGERLTEELEAVLSDALNVKRVDYEPAADSHESVRLDTSISDALRLEGLARETSRKVNALRNQAGLEVNERIVLHVDAAGDGRRAVDAHGDWLMRETLATAIEFGRADALAAWEGLIGGEPCWLGIKR